MTEQDDSKDQVDTELTVPEICKILWEVFAVVKLADDRVETGNDEYILTCMGAAASLLDEIARVIPISPTSGEFDSSVLEAQAFMRAISLFASEEHAELRKELDISALVSHASKLIPELDMLVESINQDLDEAA